MNDIIHFVKVIDEVDTQGVEPMWTPLDSGEQLFAAGFIPQDQMVNWSSRLHADVKGSVQLSIACVPASRHTPCMHVGVCDTSWDVNAEMFAPLREDKVDSSTVPGAPPC